MPRNLKRRCWREWRLPKIAPPAEHNVPPEPIPEPIRRAPRTLPIDRLLGAASIAVAVGLLFFHIPALMYVASPDSFPYTLASQFAAAALPVVVLMVVLAAPLLLRKPKVVRACAVGWFTVAVLVWVSSNLLVLKTGPLNGRLTDISVPASFTGLSNWVLAVTAIIAAAAALRVPLFAAVIAVVLNITLFATTIVRTVSDYRTKPRISADEVDAFFRFSTSRNVLVILLDTFQSDLFRDILTQDPALRHEFDGFTFFPDTAGAAPSTYVAMPAIHSGKVYAGQKSLADVYEEQVSQGSFFTALAKQGYETSVLETPGRPNGSSFLTAEAVMGADHGAVVRDVYLGLLDLSLFRIVPAQWKANVFNKGAWQLQSWVPRSANNRPYRDLRVLDVLSDKIQLSAQPTAKLLHLYISHPPVELDRNCQPTAPQAPTREGMLSQCRCAVTAVTGLLDRLRARGVYDDATIFVIADHGFGFPSTYAPGDTDSGSGWSSVVGSANPLLLWKPIGGTGEMKTSGQPVDLSDIATTACKQTGACSGYSGVPLGEPDAARERTYVHYAWSHSLWGAAVIPGARWFSVRQPIWSRSSWTRTRVPRLPEGSVIDFGANPDAIDYLDWGWSGREPLGYWSDSEQPALSFKVDRRPSGPVRLSARVYPYVRPKHPKMSVTVLANSRPVANWDFGLSYPDRDSQVILPPDAWSEDGRMTIEFDIQDPASPVSLGESTDPRLLGLLLHSIALK